ncbi:MAG: NFYB/HAP3 family transcription factor subunit [Candidatus Aenigmarchaeota archaeon]|nr:NFYB/HAP3 family transcription factor subunit [Candidatus Aenigmarchaeota archaeon]
MTKKAKETEAKKAEKKEKPKETKERFAFPEACIVRIMRKHLDKEKMIKKAVKVGMNKWLEEICAKVSKSMNKFPYVMMTPSEFSQGKKIYDTLEEFDKEKERILAHLDAMKKDIERLERDLGKVEEDVIGLS